MIESHLGTGGGQGHGTMEDPGEEDQRLIRICLLIPEADPGQGLAGPDPPLPRLVTDLDCCFGPTGAFAVLLRKGSVDGATDEPGWSLPPGKPRRPGLTGSAASRYAGEMKRWQGSRGAGLRVAGLVAGWLTGWVASGALADTWKAGAAAENITPDALMWMAGYGSRSAPAEGKETDLWAKALVLEDAAGGRAVHVTLDLVGIDRTMAGIIRERLREETGLAGARVAFSTSHTHSGPVVGQGLGPLHYLVLDAEQRKLVDDYARELPEKVLRAVRRALEDMAPAVLRSGNGRETFAVNRRNNKPEPEVVARRERGTLEGPVDHDVPVLAVRDGEGTLKAVVFGYACHATVLSGQTWNGDYPGYAQLNLEAAHPGCVALFWAGCGGDQNPLPRRTGNLAKAYGERLATEVSDVLGGVMEELSPELGVTFAEIEAPLQAVPGKEDLEAARSLENRFEVARAKMLLEQLETQGSLSGHYPFPIGVWTLGGAVEFVFLGGEVVVDYALRLKRERRGERTWVAAYSNDVMAYIPSLRVLREGGYEGGGSNVYYGLPSLWDESIEETIVAAVHRLAPLPLASGPAPAQTAP